MKFILAALLAAAALVPAPPVLAQSFDPCPDLQSADDGLLLQWFKAVFPDGDGNAQPVPGYGTHTYYFTGEASRFANVNCGGNGLIEWQEMYPIGIVVRPISKIDFPAFENVTGSDAVLVLTEYGHRKVVAAKHLFPVEADRFYLFPDEAGSALVCREAEDCPTHDRALCGEKCRDYEVHATRGFLEGRAADTGAQETLRAYRRIFPGLPGGDASATPATSVEVLRNTACAPFAVDAFLPGRIRHQPQPSYFTLCTKRSAAGADGDAPRRIKVVDSSYADAVFKLGHDSSFHRRFADHSSDESAVGRLSNLTMTSTKPCGVEQVTETEVAFAGNASINLNAAVFELQLGPQGAISQKISEVSSAENYLLTSTYFLRPFANAAAAPGEDRDEVWLFRIMFHARCENEKPEEPSSIIVQYHRLQNGYIQVDASDDLKASYLRAWKDDNYSPASNTDLIRQGQFWQIKNAQAYFLWRDTLRHFIEEENPLTSDLLASHAEAEQPIIRDFFVHLMLAAGYHHRVP